MKPSFASCQAAAVFSAALHHLHETLRDFVPVRRIYGRTMRPALVAGVGLAAALSAQGQSIPDLTFPNSASIQLKNEDMSAAA